MELTSEILVSGGVFLLKSEDNNFPQQHYQVMYPYFSFSLFIKLYMSREKSSDVKLTLVYTVFTKTSCWRTNLASSDNTNLSTSHFWEWLKILCFSAVQIWICLIIFIKVNWMKYLHLYILPWKFFKRAPLLQSGSLQTLWWKGCGDSSFKRLYRLFLALCWWCPYLLDYEALQSPDGAALKSTKVSAAFGT